ncbi:MAG: FAD-binding protein [Actinobacteria bacterium]|nr:FAD-binding protein [Actinomycetota bacterium]
MGTRSATGARAVVDREVVAALRRTLGAAVDASARRRAEYSSDASNYRVVPAAVVFPRDVDDVLAALDVCRLTGTPVTVRGGGTSVAGNAVGSGVVLDLSRHLHRVHGVDPDTRTARVDPGVVLDDLQHVARRHGLRFGPDPSTHARCTVGGMIGNNACGAHSIAYGVTADNVRTLDVVDGTGRRFTAGPDIGGDAGVTALAAAHRATITTELGRFSRQVSGYGLQHLVSDDDGRGNLAKALVGSEGTCVVVLGATVQLVDRAPATALTVLGFPDMAVAADAVPGLLGFGALAIEGIDRRLVDVVRRHRGPSAVTDDLPRGGGWLLVETGGASTAEAAAAGRRVAAGADTADAVVVPAGERAAALWRIREDGAGLSGRTPDGAPTWPGWEDAAVPPTALGAYLRDFTALQRHHGVDGVLYGHFGDGCVHVRLDLPLAERPQRLRPFLRDAATLVARHGGSLSGEHGDGRARSELLGLLYSADALAAFAEFKRHFDPDDLLNPGVLIRPRPVDADLRRPAARPLPTVGFALADDGGDLTAAVHRCVGLAKCRADTSASGGVMCPSFLATRDERDSTRGRARVLQEMANGGLVARDARAPEVHDVLDLCLSCKACASDCPAGVDMATYKAEVLHRAYRRRIRPRTHYALGWLPRWARFAAQAPRLVNAVLRRPTVRRALLRAGGMDQRRDFPPFAEQGFRRWWSARDVRTAGVAVVLWVDTFTESFAPAIARAAVAVLEAAGYRVIVAPPACCGLTWITTGQLDAARRRLGAVLDTLAPAAAAGIPIVGLEPSCTAVLRSDLGELLADDPRAAEVAGATRTLAEVLIDPPGGWRPSGLDDHRVIAQPHCHQHAVMGFAADQTLLARAGAHVDTIAGCCGLAGNFGMEDGHYDVSVAVARNGLLPALVGADDAVLLADGFSCRVQAQQLAGRDGVHLAQLLAGTLPPAPSDE